MAKWSGKAQAGFRLIFSVGCGETRGLATAHRQTSNLQTALLQNVDV